MTSSTVDTQAARALDVSIDEETLDVQLVDGRSISVPIAWYPRLVHATDEERSHWELIGDGEGVHWPKLDEDVSIRNLLEGKPSAESPSSLQKWLATRISS